MWLFEREDPLPELPLPGPWPIKRGQQAGKPLFARVNAGFQNSAPMRDYSHQEGIAAPFNEPGANGLFTSEESADLNQIEDMVPAGLGQAAESLFAVAITTSGMREFVFYTRDRDSVRQRFETLRKPVSGHELQFRTQADENWDVHAGFAAG